MSRRSRHPGPPRRALRATPAAPPAPRLSPQALVQAQTLFADAVRCHVAGQAAEAEALYRALLVLAPHHAPASYNLGVLCQAQGRLQEAIPAYRRAIELQPGDLDAYNNLGAALLDTDAVEAAIAVFQQAIARKPDFAPGVGNLGKAFMASGRYTDAVAAFRRAIEIKPDDDLAHANLAGALLEQDDIEAALAPCQQALALNPRQEVAWFNLALVHRGLGRLPQAVDAIRQAVALNPNRAEARFTLGQILLLQGDFAAGWQEYEWRWQLRAYAWLSRWLGPCSKPVWAGESLQGRTILIYAEQGMGDAIQYARYLPMVAALGAKILFAVHAPLQRLFAPLAGITVVSLEAHQTAAFDVHCPLLSLPRLFGTDLHSIPGGTPYLHAAADDVARWRQRVPVRPGKALRVGMVWGGSPKHSNDRLRSPRLRPVLPLFEVPGVTFVALQVGPARQDLADDPLPADVIDLGARIEDFADTAAILSGLDLLITSCTSVLHLAGAMDIPVWAMIPFYPHFAWLTDRTDSLWYPSLRLYRQSRWDAGWSGVVDRIAHDLTRLAAARAA